MGLGQGEKLGEGFVEIHPDTKGFEGEARKGLLTPLKLLGAGIAAGIGVAAKAGISKLTTAVGRASDLNETINKGRTIFPKASASLERWAATAVNKLGLTKGEALANTSQFGDMFRQLEIGERPAAAMSKRMVQLAADFASFHNADISEVLLAQQSAFRGEFDALQRFVPGINAARVQTEALALSHKHSAKDLTDAEKAQAAYNIMLRDGKRASGDFARTSDQQANQERILSAQTKSLSATIGGFFLPGILRVTRALTGSLMPQLTRLAKREGPAVQHAFTAMGGDVAGFISHLDLSGVAQKLPAALGQIQTKVKELVRTFQDATKEGPSLSDNLSTLSRTASVAGVGIGFLADHTDLLAKALPGLVVAFGLVKGAQAAANIAAAADVVLMPARIASNFALAGSLRAVAAAQTSGAASAATNAAAQSAAATATNVGGLAALRSAGAWLASKAAMLAGAVATRAMAIAQGLLNVVLRANPILLIVSLIAVVVVALIRWYKTSQRARDLINGAFNAIKAAGRAVWNFLVGAFHAIGGAASTLANVVVRAAKLGFLGPIPFIIANWSQILSFFKALPGKIGGFLAGLPRAMLQAGRNIVGGLIEGIKSRFGELASAASGLAKKVRDFLPFSPAKRGPLSGSGSPERSGRRLAAGIASGILRGRTDVSRAMGRLTGLGGGVGGLAGPRPAVAAGHSFTFGPGSFQVSVSGSGQLHPSQVEAAVGRAFDEFRRNLLTGRRT